MAVTNNLAAWIRTQPATTEELLYCHTTNAWDLKKILINGLSPTWCDVFNKDVLYAFYGRPAYRREIDPLNTTGKAPVVIIIKPAAIENYIDRVFPFDSGAFPSRYNHWLAHGMILEDFELDPDRHSSMRHVSSFFHNNNKYYECECDKMPTASGSEMEVETLFRIYSDTNQTAQVDDRKHSIEVQINSMIPIKDDTTEAIILPKQCLDYDFVKKFKSGGGKNVALIEYELNKHKSGNEYQALLEERAKKHQKSLLLL